LRHKVKASGAEANVATIEPMAYYAVRLEHGPAWLAGRALEEQGDWRAHAEFMDCLLAAGLVVLGGPVGEDALGAGGQVLLIFDAESEAAIRSRLAEDPWHVAGLLRVRSFESWEIRLDGRASGS